MMSEQYCDLTATAPSHLQTAVFYEIKDMTRGETATVLFAEDPAITLHSLNLQLRNNLRWEISRTDAGHWLTVIHRAEDVPPVDVFDSLKRDHKRLDAMFSQVIHLTDQNHLIEAHAIMRAFIEGLRKHFAVEHDILAKAIRTPPNAMGVDPTAAMMQEHNEILNQSIMIELSFDEEEDWKLIMISVNDDFYELEGRSLIGLFQEGLIKELDEMDLGEWSLEDCSEDDNEDQKVIEIEEKSINFWINDGVLDEIQWTPFFIDEDTIDWPE